MSRRRWPRRKDVFADPSFERWQTQRGRRTMSVAQMLLSVALAAAAALLFSDASPSWTVPLAALTTLAWVVAQGYVNTPAPNSLLRV